MERDSGTTLGDATISASGLPMIEGREERRGATWTWDLGGSTARATTTDVTVTTNGVTVAYDVTMVLGAGRDAIEMMGEGRDVYKYVNANRLEITQSVTMSYADDYGYAIMSWTAQGDVSK